MKFLRRPSPKPRPAGSVGLHIYVKLEQDDSRFPPYEAEELDGTLIYDDQARIDAIPVFVRGMARNDIVALSPPDERGRRWATAIVTNSAHGTARVVPFPPFDIDLIAPAFIELGCDAHATPFGLVAIHIAPETDAPAVRRSLEQGRDAGHWDFDYGVTPT